MKKIHLIFTFLLSLLMLSCSNGDDMGQKADRGYISINVSTLTNTTEGGTRATSAPSSYNPRQLAVEIYNEAGRCVGQYNDASSMPSSITLLEGRYDIVAHSYGWDGSGSGIEAPYYYGHAYIDVVAGSLRSVSVVCTQANVAVAIDFSGLKSWFSSATVTVKSSAEGVEPRTFAMDEASKVAYFPASELTATLTVTNNSGSTYSDSWPIKTKDGEVPKERTKFTIKFRTQQTGTGSITITTNDEQTEWNYEFYVPTEPSTQVELGRVNAWSTFAYLSGSVSSIEAGLSVASAAFYYKEKDNDAADWTEAEATYDSADEVYKAKAVNLKPDTKYSYKFAMMDSDNDGHETAVQTFTTEKATPLPNAKMDDWYTDSYPYPCSQADYVAGNLFWGTSNPGSSMLNKVVTSGESSIVHTPGGMSAKLASTKVLTTIAAASMYVGSFGATDLTTQTAKVNFGRPFDSRPSALKGWFRYSTSAIDVVGKNIPSEYGIVKGTTRDLWSCYWALMTEAFTFDNGNIAGTAVDWANDSRVIAYGALPDNQCIETNDWTQFNIPLEYKRLEKSSNMVLVLVFSASKYGDYMTGSTSSVLYIDDLELVYDEPVQ